MLQLGPSLLVLGTGGLVARVSQTLASPEGPVALPYLPKGPVELSQDAVLIKHLALVAVLIVLMDALPCVSRQLVEGHILLHLLVLEDRTMDSRKEDTETDVGPE